MDLRNLSREELISLLDESRTETGKLKAELELALSDRREREFILRERLKELDCHNRIAEILSKPDVTIEEVCTGVVGILPGSWQFPQSAEARIVLHETVFQTPGYAESRHFLRQDIISGKQVIGSIEVCYPENRLPEAIMIFLPEETKLLFSIAVKLGAFVEKEENSSQVRLTQGRFRDLVENINDVVYEVSSEGIVQYVSPAITRILGYTPEELTGKNFFAYMYPDDRPALIHALSSLGSQNYSYLEYRYYKKDGELRWVRSSTSPIYENGKVVGGRGALSDIHERKLVQERLAASEEKYRSIFENTQDIYYEADLNGHIIEISPSIATVSRGSFQRQDLLGKPIMGLYAYPEQRDALLKELYGKGKVSDYELDFVNNDGTIFPVAVSSALQFDPEGKPVKVVGSIRDISERKKAIQALESSEQKYRALFDDSLDAYLIAKNGAFVECNKASERLLRCDRSWVIGKTPPEISPEYQPNGQKSAEYVKEVIRVAYSQGYHSFEWLHTRFDGTVFLAQINLTLIEFEGSRALLVSWKDITRQREAEEEVWKLSLAVEQSPVSIIIMDPEGNIEYGNAKACESLGYSASELIGMNPRRYISEDSSPDKYQGIWENIASGCPWKGILQNRRKNGEIFWESSSITPLTDSSGRTIHYLAIQEDITDRIRMQQQLQASEERFRQVAEASQTIITETDAKGVYTFVSPMVKPVLGYEPGEMVGKMHFYEILPPEMRESSLAIYENMEPMLDVEVEVFNKERKKVWVEISSVPIFSENGDFTGYRAAMNDITSRKLAELELQKFRTISDLSNYGKAIVSMDGKLDYVNEAMAKMHGYTPEELTGQNLQIFHTPEQLVKVGGLFEKLRQNGEFQAEEVWRVARDGRVFPSLMNATVIKDANSYPLIMAASTIDITELKEAEDQIKKQTLRLEAIINTIPDLLMIWSPEGTILEYHCSDKYVSMFPAQSFINKNLRELFDLQTATVHLSRIAECLKNKSFLSYETEFTLVERFFCYEIRMAPLGEDRVTALVRNITDKKIKELEIKKLSLAVEQSPVTIVITDLAGNIEYANHAFEQTTGYPLEEVLGKSTSILKSGLTPESEYRLLWETIQAGLDWQGEWQNRKKNGELYWENISISPIFGTDGKISNYLAVKQDITDRKRDEQSIRELNANLEIRIAERTAELASSNQDLVREMEKRAQIAEALANKSAELENFFNIALDLLCIADTSGNFIKINKAWETILGYPANELENRQSLEFVHPDDLQMTLDAMSELSEQHPVLNFTNRYRTKDGSYRFIEWHSSPSGSLIYAAARDVTERKKGEEEIIKARVEAEEANQAKSEFLSRMSHELRTPMNSILGFAQLLEMGDLNPGQKKGVVHILRSGRHLLDLINEVLDISRIEAGRLTLSLEPVPAGDIILETLDTLRPLANGRNLVMHLVESATNNSFVRSDRQRLKQVLINLLTNAVKYNREGGSVIIATEVKMAEGTEPLLRISVSDTGMGISPGDLPKLFTPFERIGAESTTTEGTGLGLAVVKKLMDAMKGTVGVESELQKGSTFWLELPLAENLAGTAGKVTNAGDIHAAGSVRKGKILYIEDNVSNVELVQQILGTLYPDIQLVNSAFGRDTVHLATVHVPDLVLLDLNLPDLHGSRVIKMLHDTPETGNIPVVVISADAMNRTVESLLRQGARKFLTKPLEIPEFLKVVEEFVINGKSGKGD